MRNHIFSLDHLMGKVLDKKSPTALRTIGEVSSHLAVEPHVLRFWEGKFPQIKPQKFKGRRYYRPEDIHVLEKVKQLLYKEGYTIRGVQQYLSNHFLGKAALRKGEEAFSNSPVTQPSLLKEAPSEELTEKEVAPFSASEQALLPTIETLKEARNKLKNLLFITVPEE